jgi:hypothetical protein
VLDQVLHFSPALTEAERQDLSSTFQTTRGAGKPTDTSTQ